MLTEELAQTRTGELWRKDGTSFPAEYTSTPIKKDGEVTGAVLIFKDVTESRRDAHRLARSEHLPRQGAGTCRDRELGMGRANGTGDLVRPALPDIRLRPRRVQAELRGLHEHSPHRGPGRDGGRHRGALATREPFSTDYRVVQPDGSVRVAQSQGNVRTDERGDVVQKFGISQDVPDSDGFEVVPSERRGGEALFRVVDARLRPQTGSAGSASSTALISYDPHTLQTPKSVRPAVWAITCAPQRAQTQRISRSSGPSRCQDRRAVSLFAIASMRLSTESAL